MKTSERIFRFPLSGKKHLRGNKSRADSTHMVESALFRYALWSEEGGSLLFGDVDNLAVL